MIRLLIGGELGKLFLHRLYMSSIVFDKRAEAKNNLGAVGVRESNYGL